MPLIYLGDFLHRNSTPFFHFNNYDWLKNSAVFVSDVALENNEKKIFVIFCREKKEA